MEIHEILTALAAVIGAIAGCYSLLQQKRKTEAEALTEEATAADIIQGASKELIEQYKLRVTELSLENKALQDEIIQLKADVATLKTKVEELEQKLIKVAVENKESIEELQNLLDEKISETKNNVLEIKDLKNEIVILQEKISCLTETTKTGNGG